MRYPSAIRGLLALSIALAFTRANAQIALAEMQQISQGLDMCALDTNYYVGTETLNDTSNSNSNPIYNYINDQGGTYVIRPQEGAFLALRVNLLTAPLPWNGPYMTYQAGRTQTASTPYDVGCPLDPWGGPYYFFSPLGLLHGDNGTVTLDIYGDQFDQYTLVSLGPDGVKSGDDISFNFGATVTSFWLSSLRTQTGELAASSPQVAAINGFTAVAGNSVIVRGLNLGATQSGAKVFWGGTELTGVTSWSNRQVLVQLPSNVTGSAMVTVQRGASATNGLSLSISAPTASARDWELYR